MTKWNKESKEAKLRSTLMNHFMKGDRMTREDILTNYFNARGLEQIQIAKNTIKAVLESIKNALKEQMIPFGSLNANDEWGIPFTLEEYKYGIKIRYKFVKGTVINTDTLWVRSGNQAGFLKSIDREQLNVAKTNGEK